MIRKNNITETRIIKNIESIKVLHPKDVEDFFYWFYMTNMHVNLFDDTGLIRVHKHKAISNVVFYYTENGSYCEFLLQDTDNPNCQKAIGMTIADSIKIKESSTYSSFKSGWNVKFYEIPTLSKKVYPALFYIIKNIAKYSIIRRVLYLKDGGRYDQTIPDKFLKQPV